MNENEDDSGGRTTSLVEWTDGTKEFTVNITDEEVEKLKDASGEIQYEKLFQWCLPNFVMMIKLFHMNFKQLIYGII